MNTKLLFVLLLSGLVAGCSTGILKVQQCEPFSPPDGPCTGNPDDPKVTVNTKSLNFSPGNVCAAPGKTIVFTIVPPPGNKVGSAAIVPKKPEDTWLIGTNIQDKNEIRVTVPEWVAVDSDHDFGFVTVDGKCIDPRVHVKD